MRLNLDYIFYETKLLNNCSSEGQEVYTGGLKVGQPQ